MTIHHDDEADRFDAASAAHDAKNFRRWRDDVLARAEAGDINAVVEATQAAVNRLEMPFSIDPLEHHLKSVLDRLYAAVNEGKVADVKAALAPFKRPTNGRGRPPEMSDEARNLLNFEVALALDLLLTEKAVNTRAEGVAALAVAFGVDDRSIGRMVAPFWPVEAQLKKRSFELLAGVHARLLKVCDEMPDMYGAKLSKFLRI